MPKISIIGSGFAGLTSAITLAAKGHRVSIYEKNASIGGRARQFQSNGFTFDMGPSWYWMPDVFENFYNLHGFTHADFYELKRLDPSYRVFFEEDIVDMPASYEELESLFETLEPGASLKLHKFLKEAQFKYETGMKDLVFKPGKSVTEFFDLRVIKGAGSLQLFSSISSHIRKYFKNPKIIQLLEFPVLFLGAMPSDTPALYSLMNYADIKLGTWYPMGGMFEIVKAFEKMARHYGVEMKTSSEISGFSFDRDRVKSLQTPGGECATDGVVASADYHHVEQHLLPEQYRRYNSTYWGKRKMSPSSVLFYVGVDKPLPGLLHHNLFFDTPFDEHAVAIYQKPSWPDRPLFYVCNPSKTDPSVAPANQENIFILIPVASGLDDSQEIIDLYYDMVMSRLEKRLNTSIRDHVVYKRNYALKDFKEDYHAFKGNAYGLANTLQQTAILKPKMHSKLKNMVYAGQLTVPGPGVPPSIISGQVAANELMKQL